MKRFAAVFAVALFASTAHAQPPAAKLGEAAPNFKTVDAMSGSPVELKTLRGAPVVLEWNNFGCPFVKKHYGSGNMQSLQSESMKAGAHWIVINSSAEGKQGYLKDTKEVIAALKEQQSQPSAYVLDPTGEIGRAYGATVTPHMFVIDAEGVLVYNGAIDSLPTPNPDDIAKADNYVRDALAALREGKDVAVEQSKPYGCGVKYAF